MASSAPGPGAPLLPVVSYDHVFIVNQNQLYEKSTENDVFQMKTEKKTEGKSRRRSLGSDVQATRALRAENRGRVHT